MEVREATVRYEPQQDATCPPGYKQTEVGVIPEDWDDRDLGDVIVSLEAGVSVNSIDKDKNVSAHDMSILKTSCVIGGKFIPEECKTIVDRDLHRAKLNPRKDTILFSRMNTPALVGECGYVDRDYPNLFLPDRLWMTRHDNNAPHCVRWLAYLLSSRLFNRVIKESATGTSGSMKNISKSSLLGVRIPFPPTKAEQEAIAEALSDADALIESLAQLLAKKRHLKQGAMQELLTGKQRLPGFSGEWEVKRLGDVASLYQPVTISANQFKDSGYPVYGANGIVGHFDKFNHETWQVTVTCRGSTCGTVNRTVDKCWITGNAMVVNCEESAQVDKAYIYYLLSSKDLSICITGTGQPQIVRTPLSNYELNIPINVDEQTAIATILSDMDTEIAALEEKLAKARHLKQGMMQELLTGRIRLV